MSLVTLNYHSFEYSEILSDLCHIGNLNLEIVFVDVFSRIRLQFLDLSHIQSIVIKICPMQGLGWLLGVWWEKVVKISLLDDPWGLHGVLSERAIDDFEF